MLGQPVNKSCSGLAHATQVVLVLRPNLAVVSAALVRGLLLKKLMLLV
jgi:hypothetical protein